MRTRRDMHVRPVTPICRIEPKTAPSQAAIDDWMARRKSATIVVNGAITRAYADDQNAAKREVRRVKPGTHRIDSKGQPYNTAISEKSEFVPGRRK